MLSHSTQISRSNNNNINNNGNNNSPNSNDKQRLKNRPIPSILLESLDNTYSTSKYHKIVKGDDISNISNKHRTIVEIECVFDAKGGIPTWFINFMQQSWPHK